MPSRTFQNVEIWALVTYMIIAITSSFLRNKLPLLKSTYFLKKSHNLKNPCMKEDRQLNLKKKEKIGERGVTSSNSQQTIKNLPKISIPPPTELLCLPPNQKIFKKHLRRRFIYQNNFCNFSTIPYI